MKIATAVIEGVSPYSQSKHIDPEEFPKLQGESSRDYEVRTWRNRLHRDENENVIIPPMAFKNCLAESAKFLSLQIPGKGKATYTKHFEAGVLVTDPIVLPIKVSEVMGETLHVPSDGVRGSGKRVSKIFPIIRQWGGKIQILVFDETVLGSYDDKGTKKTVLQYVFEQGGMFIGVGRFRPRNNGFYGRFAVKSFKVEDA